MAIDFRPNVNIPPDIFSSLANRYSGGLGAFQQNYQDAQKKAQWKQTLDALVQQNPQMAAYRGIAEQAGPEATMQYLVGPAMKNYSKMPVPNYSFQYARSIATDAGQPNAAEDIIANAKAQGRPDLTKQEIQDMQRSMGTKTMGQRGAYFDIMGGVITDRLRESLINDARSTLNPYFEKGPGKEQATRLDAISRAEPLVKQMLSQPQGGDPRQMVELATSLNRVLTGSGQQAQQQIEHLIPQTLRGRAANWLEWFSNAPQGTAQQAFIKRFAETLSREKNAIQQRVAFQAERNAPTLRVLKKKYPEDYKAVIDSVISQFGRPAESTFAGTSADPGSMTDEDLDAEIARLQGGR